MRLLLSATAPFLAETIAKQIPSQRIRRSTGRTPPPPRPLLATLQFQSSTLVLFGLKYRRVVARIECGVASSQRIRRLVELVKFWLWKLETTSTSRRIGRDDKARPNFEIEPDFGTTEREQPKYRFSSSPPADNETLEPCCRYEI